MTSVTSLYHGHGYMDIVPLDLLRRCSGQKAAHIVLPRFLGEASRQRSSSKRPVLPSLAGAYMRIVPVD